MDIQHPITFLPITVGSQPAVPALLCWVPLPGPSRTGGGWRGPRGTKGTLGWQVLLLLSVIQKK